MSNGGKELNDGESSQERVERRWCQGSADTEKKTAGSPENSREDHGTSGVHIHIL